MAEETAAWKQEEREKRRKVVEGRLTSPRPSGKFIPRKDKGNQWRISWRGGNGNKYGNTYMKEDETVLLRQVFAQKNWSCFSASERHSQHLKKLRLHQRDQKTGRYSNET